MKGYKFTVMSLTAAFADGGVFSSAQHARLWCERNGRVMKVFAIRRADGLEFVQGTKTGANIPTAEMKRFNAQSGDVFIYN